MKTKKVKINYTREFKCKSCGNVTTHALVDEKKHLWRCAICRATEIKK